MNMVIYWLHLYFHWRIFHIIDFFKFLTMVNLIRIYHFQREFDSNNGLLYVLLTILIIGFLKNLCNSRIKKIFILIQLSEMHWAEGLTLVGQPTRDVRGSSILWTNTLPTNNITKPTNMINAPMATHTFHFLAIGNKIVSSTKKAKQKSMHYVKYAWIRIFPSIVFPYKNKIVGSILIRENICKQNLHSDIFYTVIQWYSLRPTTQFQLIPWCGKISKIRMSILQCLQLILGLG